MPYTDKSLACVDCGAEFVYSVADQEFHASRGFTNEPRRCPDCRRARKSARGDEGGGGGYGGGGGGGGSYSSGPRQMYPAVCAGCNRVRNVAPDYVQLDDSVDEITATGTNHHEDWNSNRGDNCGNHPGARRRATVVQGGAELHATRTGMFSSAKWRSVAARVPEPDSRTTSICSRRLVIRTCSS